MSKLNKTFKINPLYETDGYKVGHKAMLAPGTTKLYGTWIPRNLKYMPGGIDKIMSVGQQLVVRHLHSTFQENFFEIPDVSERECKKQAMKFVSDMTAYLGMDYDGKHFEDLWYLGYLPIKIKSLPEGIFTQPNVPHMTFVNTVDGYAWLTLFLETYISKLAWQMPTAATIAHKFRTNANEWVSKTDPTNLWLTEFMCHDFHSRGGNPFTSIAVGLGHATSNKGSDTLNVIPASRYYYDEDPDSMPIYSVNASEHSVSTTKIFTVGEQQMISDWLTLFPKGILSIVADTFDLWKLITEYLPANKDAIMARDGKLVIRPDSGNPVDIICGLNIQKVSSLKDAIGRLKDLVHSEASELTADECGDSEYSDIFNIEDLNYKVTVYPEWNRHDKTYYYVDGFDTPKSEIATLESDDKGVIELLWDIFGGTVTEQGYKVLDSHIGAIYGDSINLDRQVEIYKRLEAKGFAATNIVLGVGSFTYVMLTRDSAGYAAKGAWFEVEELKTAYTSDGLDYKEKVKTSYEIYKDPVTDDGTKRSLKGLLSVTNPNRLGEYIVQQGCIPEDENRGLLQVIYENGQFFNQTTLTEIYKTVNQ